MQWLPALFRHAAKAPERSPLADPARFVRMWWVGKGPPEVKYHAAVQAAEAMCHPIVHRCLNKLGSSVSTAGWYAERDSRASAVDAATRTTATERDLAAVLESPNGDMSAAFLRFWMALSLAAYGVVYLKVGRGALGAVNALYPLDAANVRRVVDGRGVIIGYEHTSGTVRTTIPTRREAEKRDKPNGGTFNDYVARIALPGLVFGSDGLALNSPLQSLGMPAQIIKLLMQRAAETASGHPNSRYIITSDALITRAQEDEARRSLEERQVGGEESGTVLFAAGPNMKVTKLDNDLADIHSKMPLDDMARQIAGGFGIPIALIGLGSADSAKFAGNYIESRRAFWEDTVDPLYLGPIEQGLTAAICPAGYTVKFDRDTIPALQEARAAKAATLEKVSFLTDEEKRELCGFPPLRPGQRTSGELLTLPAATNPREAA